LIEVATWLSGQRCFASTGNCTLATLDVVVMDSNMGSPPSLNSLMADLIDVTDGQYGVLLVVLFIIRDRVYTSAKLDALNSYAHDFPNFCWE
jgi:hypothetical protein